MKRITCSLLGLFVVAALCNEANAQKEGKKGAAGGGDRLQMMETRFKAMDSNNDGFVTLAEFKAFAAKESAEMFKKMDANNDGKVTKEEMQAFREKMRQEYPGRPAPGAGAGRAEMPDSMTLDQFKAFREKRVEFMFKQIDRKGDGKITLEDMKNAFKAMAAQRQADGATPEAAPKAGEKKFGPKGSAANPN